MKRIPALVAWLAIAAAPRAPAGSGGRDGEVRAVSVLPASASVDVVIDLRGAVDVQDFTLPSPARLVLDLQGARLAAALAAAPAPSRRGGEAARVATPAPGEAARAINQYLSAHADEGEQSQAPRITVTWDNADLREVTSGFAAFSGRTIILSKDIKGNVSAEIKNQPWDLAFNAVLESQGLAANVLEGGIIQVIDKKDLARADSTVPVETRLVRVNYARASALLPSVQSLLTKRGAVVADSNSNALVITEVTTRINRVEEFVKGLDIRTPQVSIQAKIIFVDRTDVEELGLKYDLGTHFPDCLPTCQYFNQLF